MLSSPSTVVLVEGRVGALSGRITLEHTANGGRQITYRLGDQDVTREVFTLALRFASAMVEERIADLLAHLVDRCGDPQ